jgi:hypothetical protein
MKKKKKSEIVLDVSIRSLYTFSCPFSPSLPFLQISHTTRRRRGETNGPEGLLRIAKHPTGTYFVLIATDK